jgi:TIR domain
MHSADRALDSLKRIDNIKTLKATTRPPHHPLTSTEGTVSLSLLDPDGHPLRQKVMVSLTPVKGGADIEVVADIGHTTNLRITGVPIGLYRLTVKPASFPPVTRFVLVQARADAKAQEIIFNLPLGKANRFPGVLSERHGKDEAGPTRPKGIRVFVSYAHKDERFRRALDEHLAPLKQKGWVEVWHDREIVAGEEFEDVITEQLEKAKLILLLVSPAFVSSVYCYGKEMKRALERHARKSAHVIPVILRPVAWQLTPLGELLALPTDGKPVTKWSNRDAAFLDVVTGIETALQKLA